MKKIKSHIAYLLIFISSVAFSQIKKAEKYYANFNYPKAIVVYEKIAKSNSKDKQLALIKLADCYRILNNYSKAETSYAQAISIGKVPVIVNYNYGNILKSNNKYQEALEQYRVYLDSNKESATAKYAIKSCQEIKYWESKPKEYEVKNIESINTKRSEFSPVVKSNKLIYVAEKIGDIVDFETSSTNNQPYLNIFSSEIKNSEIQKGKLLSSKINSDFHDGPISYTEDGKLAAFTHVDYLANKKNKNFVNRAKIYFTNVDGNKYSKPVAFVYNSDDYSCSHPALSADGLWLYFSSDMPGSVGGHDIWVCEKNGNSWDKPINLGFDVNTSENEVFPTIRKDGMLYFSSTGLPGFGDLDIFTAKQIDGRWLLNRNEGLHLNSKSDDFGITFLNDSTGYFSSNREGGKGEDDIYYFKFTNKNTVVDGTILLTENLNDPAADVKVYLLDQDGKTIDSTKTNEKGYFVFNNIPIDQTFMAEVEGTELNIKSKSRYYLADKNSNISRITHSNGNGKKFIFRNLPIDPNGIPDLYNDDDLSLGGNLLIGENPKTPLSNKKVTIKNEFGDVVLETVTDENGAFVFRNLPLDQNYSITIDETDLPLNAKITMTNKKGKEVKFARSSNKNNFKYNLLAIDKQSMSDLTLDDDVSLTGSISIGEGQGTPFANKKVFAKNALGQIIAETTTNETGGFVFKNLPLDKNYSIVVDDSDIALDSKITLRNKVGKEVKVSRSGEKGKFNFTLLGIDKQAMSDVDFDDDISLGGNLVIGDGIGKPLINKKVYVKNEMGEIVGETTTNEFGAFVFRNLPLDKNYSIVVDDNDIPLNSKITLRNKNGKDIKVSRTDSKGNFNFELLAIDKQSINDLFIDDIDLMMTLNGYIYDQNKKAISNMKVTVLNNDSIVEKLMTDEKGKFVFKNLVSDEDYMFEIDESDPRFKSITKIYVANAKGKIYKEILRNIIGKFEFALLEIDKTTLGEFSVDDPWLGVLNVKNKKNEAKPISTKFNETNDITIISEHLYYALNDYEIDNAGYNILDKVITVLYSNKNLHIELSSHTDSRSSDEFNMVLSQKRANAVVEYLISRGIHKNRLSAVGYGETKLLNKCGNNVPCTEEEHAMNRRTEFKVFEVEKNN